jgi:hypothetical protein
MTKKACAMLLGMVAFAVSLLGGASSSAAASECATCMPWWHMTLQSRSTVLPREGSGEVVVVASNLGDGVADGEASPIRIVDRLPERLVATGVSATADRGSGKPVSCNNANSGAPECVFEGEVPPYQRIEMIIQVRDENARNGEPVEASISGGGGAPATVSRGLSVSREPVVKFGVESLEVVNEEAGGEPDRQAGSHPFQTTFTVTVNQLAAGEVKGKPSATPAAMVRDLHVALPPGLVGNPTPIAQCTLGEFFHVPDPTCPAASVLGVAITTFSEPNLLGIESDAVPVFNLEPQEGEPARFGYLVTPEAPVFIDAAVRSGEDYGIMGNVNQITQTAALISSEVVLWGTPGAAEHDATRGDACLGIGANSGETCQPLAVKSPPPFFEVPSACDGPMQASVAGDSWEEPIPSGALPTLATYPMPSMVGCNRLPFHPSIRVTPDGDEASTPTGLTVDVHNPQQASLNAEGRGEADVKDITVALPAGVAINPSGGNELEACSESLVGFQGLRELSSLPGVASPIFSGSLPSPLLQGTNFCANASKIGTAKVVTPLLAHPLEGAVYLANQNQNPFGTLISMYIVARDPGSGVLIELAGQTQLCQSTGEVIAGMTCEAAGQLVATVENNPQAPFEDAELHFFGEARAPLATPARCGTYTTRASFVPWSAEPSDQSAVTVTSQSSFAITSGPHGSACPGASLPFSPTLTAGAINNDGGAFSPLSTTIGREDGEQDLQAVTMHFPPGVSGQLSSVKLCPEAQANEGTCGPESLIGETTVSAGLGADPVSVKGGQVYITEKYDGAPYGLSIVNPVKAGPFDLEHDTSKPATNMPSCDCIVVRAKIEVDPHTAQLTVTTDPSGPHSIPHFIDGIPVQIRKVNVLINRPGFTFNPTDCKRMQITGAISSDEGASSPVSVPFDVANCASLAFEPQFQVTTQAKTSKKGGASLHVNMRYPSGALGKDANLQYVKVELPKALPSRLETLKQACLEAIFNANPASCPAGSIVGHATVRTPVLSVPLSGPAYFVSHGGKEFPSLTIVLQGDGVTVQLVGETFISKGVTSSTFNSTPDVPFDSFELTLPTGAYSALAANGNLCDQKLIMPTRMIGQNGAQIQQQTRIAVQGCPGGLKVLSKKVTGRTLKLRIVAPSAGKLKAFGKGLSSASRSASGREALTLVLHMKKARGARRRIKLTFMPTKGKRLTKTLSLKLRRG